jgi:Na+/proline symporter
MRSIIALAIIGSVIVGTAGFGIFGVRKVKIDPTQFIVGGRSLGAIFLWLLMAGEVYTSFTFLGAAGWAYSKGAPAFYIICYLTVACILSFFYLPPIWRTARRHSLLTSADYFAVKYQSPLLGALVALVGVVFLVPYITLQLTGIQILLQIAGYGTIDSVLAAGLAFGLIVAFVLVSGLRGAAWASLIKDALVLGAVLFAGIVLPIQFFGSPKGVIDQVLKVQPNWMTLAGGTNNFGTVWFVSTVLLTGFGGFMWPHSIAAVYAAKSEEAVRCNAIILPFYQIMLLLVYFAGFTALLIKPGLKGSEVDQSFMLVVQQHYAPWVLGLVGAAGSLAALVPGSRTNFGGRESPFAESLWVWSSGRKTRTAHCRYPSLDRFALDIGLRTMGICANHPGRSPADRLQRHHSDFSGIDAFAPEPATTSVEPGDRNSGWTSAFDCVRCDWHQHSAWGEFWSGSAHCEYSRLVWDGCSAESGGNQDRKPSAG